MGQLASSSSSAAPSGSASLSYAYKSGRRSRILVVDGESVAADNLAEVLRQNGYASETAYEWNGALQKALISPPDLVITDVVLPGVSGVQLAVTIKRAYPDCKIL